MGPWAETLGQAEDTLRKLEEVAFRVRAGWPAFGSSANGAASDGSFALESLRQLAGELSEMIGRCEELLQDAKALVEAAWRNLDEGKHSDWDVAGRCVLQLLDLQAESIGNAAELLRQIAGHVVRFDGLPTGTVVAEHLHRGSISGLTGQELERLTAGLSQLLTLARDFRDSWPWSTGSKPDDDEDAAAVRRAMQALPPFEVLARLAVKFPPSPGWFQSE